MKSSQLIIGLLMIAVGTEVSLAMQPRRLHEIPIEEIYRNHLAGIKARNHISEINKARRAQGLKGLSLDEWKSLEKELFENPDYHTDEKPI